MTSADFCDPMCHVSMEASVLDLRKRDCHAIILPVAEKKKVKVADLSAFGMWADRDDLKAPVAFVEQLCKPRQF